MLEFLKNVGEKIVKFRRQTCFVVEGTAQHEHIGSKYLTSLGFPPRVTDFVSGHVLAKRYLVFKNPEYHAQLSEASKCSAN